MFIVILYNAIAINDTFRSVSGASFTGLRVCAKRGIRVYGQSAKLDVSLLFTFKDWNLSDDMP